MGAGVPFIRLHTGLRADTPIKDDAQVGPDRRHAMIDPDRGLVCVSSRFRTAA